MTKQHEPTDREVWRHIGELWFSGASQQRFHAACGELDVSPPQLKALLSMEAGASQSMRVLAEDWQCDASWVTGIVDGLEERGYVERRVHPTDRRVKVVALTSLGEKAKAQALDLLYEPPALLHTNITAAELKTLLGLLRKLRAS